jgi:hypothetical protein
MKKIVVKCESFAAFNKFELELGIMSERRSFYYERSLLC